MIEIVINYDPTKKIYKVYEPGTDTILVSANLTEALVNLSKFLVDSGLIVGDILNETGISYHFDSYTMKSMIESNVNLRKRLVSAPSGFMMSSQKFGSTTSGSVGREGNKNNSNKGFRGKSSSFSGKTGFSASSKKFGGKY